MEILKEPTEENPVTVNNYPYGFKKTEARFWIDTGKKGQRVVFQTLNPKTGVWNKPKLSTYSDIRVLYRNDSNGHIENTGLDFGSTGEEELKEFVNTFGTVLTDWQLNRLLVLKAIIKTRKVVTVSITDKIDEEQQKKVKKDIKKIFIHNLKELGG